MRWITVGNFTIWIRLLLTATSDASCFGIWIIAGISIWRISDGAWRIGAVWVNRGHSYWSCLTYQHLNWTQFILHRKSIFLDFLLFCEKGIEVTNRENAFQHFKSIRCLTLLNDRSHRSIEHLNPQLNGVCIRWKFDLLVAFSFIVQAEIIALIFKRETKCSMSKMATIYQFTFAYQLRVNDALFKQKQFPFVPAP